MIAGYDKAITFIVLLIAIYKFDVTEGCGGSRVLRRLGGCSGGRQLVLRRYCRKVFERCRCSNTRQYVGCTSRRLGGGTCSCHVHGDPHYDTYDGIRINYQGFCKYIMTQPRNRLDTCFFRIVGQNHRKGGKNHVSWIQNYELRMYGSSFRVDQGRRFYLNGRARGSNYSFRGGLIRVFRSGKWLHVTNAQCGITMYFDGNFDGYIKLNRGKWSGRMEGLCGNCNGNRNDDIRDRNGRVWPNNQHGWNRAGQSWLVPGSRTPWGGHCGTPRPARCNHRYYGLLNQRKFCGGLRERTGPFRTCSFRRHNLQELFQDCRYDLCAYMNNVQMRDMLRCRYYNDYARYCKSIGVAVGDWRTYFACGGCPRDEKHRRTRCTNYKGHQRQMVTTIWKQVVNGRCVFKAKRYNRMCRCRRPTKALGDCVNKRKALTIYFYKNKGTHCQRVKKVRYSPCNCKGTTVKKSPCRNHFQIIVTMTYKFVGQRCAKIGRGKRVRCGGCPKQVIRKRSPCNIQRNGGLSRRVITYKIRLIRNRCMPYRVSTTFEVCRCPKNKTHKSGCGKTHQTVTRVIFIRRGNRCDRKIYRKHVICRCIGPTTANLPCKGRFFTVLIYKYVIRNNKCHKVLAKRVREFCGCKQNFRAITKCKGYFRRIIMRSPVRRGNNCFPGKILSIRKFRCACRRPLIRRVGRCVNFTQKFRRTRWNLVGTKCVVKHEFLYRDCGACTPIRQNLWCYGGRRSLIWVYHFYRRNGRCYFRNKITQKVVNGCPKNCLSHTYYVASRCVRGGRYITKTIISKTRKINGACRRHIRRYRTSCRCSLRRKIVGECVGNRRLITEMKEVKVGRACQEVIVKRRHIKCQSCRGRRIHRGPCRGYRRRVTTLNFLPRGNKCYWRRTNVRHEVCNCSGARIVRGKCINGVEKSWRIVRIKQGNRCKNVKAFYRKQKCLTRCIGRTLKLSCQNGVLSLTTIIKYRGGLYPRRCKHKKLITVVGGCGSPKLCRTITKKKACISNGLRRVMIIHQRQLGRKCVRRLSIVFRADKSCKKCHCAPKIRTYCKGVHLYIHRVTKTRWLSKCVKRVHLTRLSGWCKVCKRTPKNVRGPCLTRGFRVYYRIITTKVGRTCRRKVTAYRRKDNTCGKKCPVQTFRIYGKCIRRKRVIHVFRKVKYRGRCVPRRITTHTRKCNCSNRKVTTKCIKNIKYVYLWQQWKHGKHCLRKLISKRLLHRHCDKCSPRVKSVVSCVKNRYIIRVFFWVKAGNKCIKRSRHRIVKNRKCGILCKGTRTTKVCRNGTRFVTVYLKKLIKKRCVLIVKKTFTLNRCEPDVTCSKKAVTTDRCIGRRRFVNVKVEVRRYGRCYIRNVRVLVGPCDRRCRGIVKKKRRCIRRRRYVIVTYRRRVKRVCKSITRAYYVDHKCTKIPKSCRKPRSFIKCLRNRQRYVVVYYYLRRYRRCIRRVKKYRRGLCNNGCSKRSKKIARCAGKKKYIYVTLYQKRNGKCVKVNKRHYAGSCIKSCRRRRRVLSHCSGSTRLTIVLSYVRRGNKCIRQVKKFRHSRCGKLCNKGKNTKPRFICRRSKLLVRVTIYQRRNRRCIKYVKIHRIGKCGRPRCRKRVQTWTRCIRRNRYIYTRYSRKRFGRCVTKIKRTNTGTCFRVCKPAKGRTICIGKLKYVRTTMGRLIKGKCRTYNKTVYIGRCHPKRCDPRRRIRTFCRGRFRYNLIQYYYLSWKTCRPKKLIKRVGACRKQCKKMWRKPFCFRGRKYVIVKIYGLSKRRCVVVNSKTHPAGYCRYGPCAPRHKVFIRCVKNIRYALVRYSTRDFNSRYKRCIRRTRRVRLTKTCGPLCKKVIKSKPFCIKTRKYRFLFIRYKRGGKCVSTKRRIQIGKCGIKDPCKKRKFTIVRCLKKKRRYAITIHVFKRGSKCVRKTSKRYLGRCDKNCGKTKQSRPFCRGGYKYRRITQFVKKGKRCVKITKEIKIGKCRVTCKKIKTWSKCIKNRRYIFVRFAIKRNRKCIYRTRKTSKKICRPICSSLKTRRKICRGVKKLMEVTYKANINRRCVKRIAYVPIGRCNIKCNPKIRKWTRCWKKMRHIFVRFSYRRGLKCLWRTDSRRTGRCDKKCIKAIRSGKPFCRGTRRFVIVGVKHLVKGKCAWVNRTVYAGTCKDKCQPNRKVWSRCSGRVRYIFTAYSFRFRWKCVRNTFRHKTGPCGPVCKKVQKKTTFCRRNIRYVIVIYGQIRNRKCIKYSRTYHFGRCKVPCKKQVRVWRVCQNKREYLKKQFYYRHFGNCYKRLTRRIIGSCVENKKCKKTVSEKLICRRGRRFVIVTYWRRYKNICRVFKRTNWAGYCKTKCSKKRRSWTKCHGAYWYVYVQYTFKHGYRCIKRVQRNRTVRCTKPCKRVQKKKPFCRRGRRYIRFIIRYKKGKRCRTYNRLHYYGPCPFKCNKKKHTWTRCIKGTRYIYERFIVRRAFKCFQKTKRFHQGLCSKQCVKPIPKKSFCFRGRRYSRVLLLIKINGKCRRRVKTLYLGYCNGPCRLRRKVITRCQSGNRYIYVYFSIRWRNQCLRRVNRKLLQRGCNPKCGKTKVSKPFCKNFRKYKTVTVSVRHRKTKKCIKIRRTVYAGGPCISRCDKRKVWSHCIRGVRYLYVRYYYPWGNRCVRRLRRYKKSVCEPKCFKIVKKQSFCRNGRTLINVTYKKKNRRGKCKVFRRNYYAGICPGPCIYRPRSWTICVKGKRYVLTKFNMKYRKRCYRRFTRRYVGPCKPKLCKKKPVKFTYCIRNHRYLRVTVYIRIRGKCYRRVRQHFAGICTVKCRKRVRSWTRCIGIYRYVFVQFHIKRRNRCIRRIRRNRLTKCTKPCSKLVTRTPFCKNLTKYLKVFMRVLIKKQCKLFRRTYKVGKCGKCRLRQRKWTKCIRGKGQYIFVSYYVKYRNKCVKRVKNRRVSTKCFQPCKRRRPIISRKFCNWGKRYVTITIFKPKGRKCIKITRTIREGRCPPPCRRRRKVWTKCHGRYRYVYIRKSFTYKKQCRSRTQRYRSVICRPLCTKLKQPKRTICKRGNKFIIVVLNQRINNRCKKIYRKYPVGKCGRCSPRRRVWSRCYRNVRYVYIRAYHRLGRTCRPITTRKFFKKPCRPLCRKVRKRRVYCTKNKKYIHVTVVTKRGKKCFKFNRHYRVGVCNVVPCVKRDKSWTRCYRNKRYIYNLVIKPVGRKCKKRVTAVHAGPCKKLCTNKVHKRRFCVRQKKYMHLTIIKRVGRRCVKYTRKVLIGKCGHRCPKPKSTVRCLRGKRYIYVVFYMKRGRKCIRRSTRRTTGPCNPFCTKTKRVTKRIYCKGNKKFIKVSIRIKIKNRCVIKTKTVYIGACKEPKCRRRVKTWFRCKKPLRYIYVRYYVKVKGRCIRRVVRRLAGKCQCVNKPTRRFVYCVRGRKYVRVTFFVKRGHKCVGKQRRYYAGRCPYPCPPRRKVFGKCINRSKYVYVRYFIKWRKRCILRVRRRKVGKCPDKCSALKKRHVYCVRNRKYINVLIRKTYRRRCKWFKRRIYIGICRVVPCPPRRVLTNKCIRNVRQYILIYSYKKGGRCLRRARRYPGKKCGHYCSKKVIKRNTVCIRFKKYLEFIKFVKKGKTCLRRVGRLYTGRCKCRKGHRTWTKCSRNKLYVYIRTVYISRGVCRTRLRRKDLGKCSPICKRLVTKRVYCSKGIKYIQINITVKRGRKCRKYVRNYRISQCSVPCKRRTKNWTKCIGKTKYYYYQQSRIWGKRCVAFITRRKLSKCKTNCSKKTKTVGTLCRRQIKYANVRIQVRIGRRCVWRRKNVRIGSCENQRPCSKRNRIIYRCIRRRRFMFVVRSLKYKNRCINRTTRKYVDNCAKFCRKPVRHTSFCIGRRRYMRVRLAFKIKGKCRSVRRKYLIGRCKVPCRPNKPVKLNCSRGKLIVYLKRWFYWKGKCIRRVHRKVLKRCPKICRKTQVGKLLCRGSTKYRRVVLHVRKGRACVRKVVNIRIGKCRIPCKSGYFVKTRCIRRRRYNYITRVKRVGRRCIRRKFIKYDGVCGKLCNKGKIRKRVFCKSSIKYITVIYSKRVGRRCRNHVRTYRVGRCGCYKPRRVQVRCIRGVRWAYVYTSARRGRSCRRLVHVVKYGPCRPPLCRKRKLSKIYCSNNRKYVKVTIYIKRGRRCRPSVKTKRIGICNKKCIPIVNVSTFCKRGKRYINGKCTTKKGKRCIRRNKQVNVGKCYRICRKIRRGRSFCKGGRSYQPITIWHRVGRRCIALRRTLKLCKCSVPCTARRRSWIKCHGKRRYVYVRYFYKRSNRCYRRLRRYYSGICYPPCNRKVRKLYLCIRGRRFLRITITHKRGKRCVTFTRKYYVSPCVLPCRRRLRKRVSCSKKKIKWITISFYVKVGSRCIRRVIRRREGKCNCYKKRPVKKVVFCRRNIKYIRLTLYVKRGTKCIKVHRVHKLGVCKCRKDITRVKCVRNTRYVYITQFKRFKSRCLIKRITRKYGPCKKLCKNGRKVVTRICRRNIKFVRVKLWIRRGRLCKPRERWYRIGVCGACKYQRTWTQCHRNIRYIYSVHSYRFRARCIRRTSRRRTGPCKKLCKPKIIRKTFCRGIRKYTTAIIRTGKKCRVIKRTFPVGKCQRCTSRRIVRKPCINKQRYIVVTYYIKVRGRCFRRVARKKISNNCGKLCNKVLSRRVFCQKGSKYMRLLIRVKRGKACKVIRRTVYVGKCPNPCALRKASWTRCHRRRRYVYVRFYIKIRGRCIKKVQRKLVNKNCTKPCKKNVKKNVICRGRRKLLKTTVRHKVGKRCVNTVKYFKIGVCGKPCRRTRAWRRCHGRVEYLYVRFFIIRRGRCIKRIKAKRTRRNCGKCNLRTKLRKIICRRNIRLAIVTTWHKVGRACRPRTTITRIGRCKNVKCKKPVVRKKCIKKWYKIFIQYYVKWRNQCVRRNYVRNLKRCDKICKKPKVLGMKCVNNRRYKVVSFGVRVGKRCIRRKKNYYVGPCGIKPCHNKVIRRGLKCINKKRYVYVRFQFKRRGRCLQRVQRKFVGPCTKICKRVKRKYVCHGLRRYIYFTISYKRGRACVTTKRRVRSGICKFKCQQKRVWSRCHKRIRYFYSKYYYKIGKRCIPRIHVKKTVICYPLCKPIKRRRTFCKGATRLVNVIYVYRVRGRCLRRIVTLKSGRCKVPCKRIKVVKFYCKGNKRYMRFTLQFPHKNKCIKRSETRATGPCKPCGPKGGKKRIACLRSGKYLIVTIGVRRKGNCIYIVEKRKLANTCRPKCNEKVWTKCIGRTKYTFVKYIVRRRGKRCTVRQYKKRVGPCRKNCKKPNRIVRKYCRGNRRFVVYLIGQKRGKRCVRIHRTYYFGKCPIVPCTRRTRSWTKCIKSKMYIFVSFYTRHGIHCVRKIVKRPTRKPCLNPCARPKRSRFCQGRKRYILIVYYVKRGGKCVRLTKKVRAGTCPPILPCKRPKKLGVRCIRGWRYLTVLIYVKHRGTKCRPIVKRKRLAKCSPLCNKPRVKKVCLRNRKFAIVWYSYRRGRRCIRVKHVKNIGGKCRTPPCARRTKVMSKCIGGNKYIFVQYYLIRRGKCTLIIARRIAGRCPIPCNRKRRVVKKVCERGRKYLIIQYWVKVGRRCVAKRRVRFAGRCPPVLCKPNARVIRRFRCTCLKKKVMCYRRTVVRISVRRGGRCKPLNKLVTTPCKNSCLDTASKKRCLHYRRLKRCRYANVQKVCHKTCRRNCKCTGVFKWHGKCVKRGKIGIKVRYIFTYVKYKGICTLRKLKFSKKCNIKKPCKTRSFKVPKPCVNGRRTVIYVSIKNSRGRCREFVRRRTFSCDWCCTTVKVTASQCKRGKRVVTKVWWVRSGKVCRVMKSIRRVRCDGGCTKYRTTFGRCQNHYRLIFRHWQQRVGRRCVNRVNADMGRC